MLGWLLAAGVGSSAVAATLYQGGKAVALRQDANHFLVEVDPMAISSPQLKANLAAEGFFEVNPIVFACNQKRAVYSVTVPTTDAHTLNVLRTIPGVRAARRLFLAPESDAPLVQTNEFVFKAKPGVTEAQVRDLAQRQGCEVVRTMGIGVKMYVLRLTDETRADALDTAAATMASGLAEFAHPDLYVEKRVHQIDDPLFPNQWHLQNRGQNGGKPGADVKALEAWNTTLGEGAIVAILDDAVDWKHPDLVDNVVARYNFVNDTDDPSPFRPDLSSTIICVEGCTNTDLAQTLWCNLCDLEPYLTSCQNRHGTATAGLAVARANNIGVRGVAPMAGLVAEAMLEASIVAMADAFYFAEANGAQVVSNSWGFTIPQLLPDVIRTAIEDISANGRGGRGVLVMFSAGNGATRIDKDNSLATLPEVMAIGATLKDDRLTCYSSYGPQQSIVAPGGGFGSGWDYTSQSCYQPDITTTDVTSIPIEPPCNLNAMLSDPTLAYSCSFYTITYPPPPAPPIFVQQFPVWSYCPYTPLDLHGYNPPDPPYLPAPIAKDYDDPYYHNGFNGTSAACPIAAGCAALVFSVDPSLTASQVRNILEHTADKIRVEGAGYDPVTGHNDMYGYGRVNAARAVQAAAAGRIWPSPVTGIRVNSIADQVHYDWTNPPADVETVLIVRSVGPLNFAPVDGQTYAVGQQVAANTVVVANDLITSYTDSAAPSGDLNYGIFVKNASNFYSWGKRLNVQARSVPNAPLASATASPSAGPAPLTVLFSGGAIDPQERQIVSYAWEFGDGATGTGASIEHTYARAGEYLAKLTVTNSIGLPAVATVLVTVEPPGSG
ncbi:MAG: S8 family serine peptidase, partial [Phycisphaerae bacterium]